MVDSMGYLADKNRYASMQYRRCGKSGIQLPLISLGLWQNFGDVNNLENSRELLRTAFDNGITHFDLANNYGPPPGSAEKNFGRILKEDFLPYRDELILSSKAGYTMWDGPYGDWGSKKYLIASLDQSLRRMGLSYVDIFYHHRPDPNTPLEETMDALAHIVRSGKALYVGISNYPAQQAKKAVEILAGMGVHCLIHQPSYSMLNRWIEDGLQDVLDEAGVGSIAFCPLQQGLLTGRYLNGVPEDSRFHRYGHIDEAQVDKARRLNEIAAKRGQTLAQMAIAWILRDGRVTSALIGASKVEQLKENLGALKNLSFSREELDAIDGITL